MSTSEAPKFEEDIEYTGSVNGHSEDVTGREDESPQVSLLYDKVIEADPELKNRDQAPPLQILDQVLDDKNRIIFANIGVDMDPSTQYNYALIPPDRRNPSGNFSEQIIKIYINDNGEVEFAEMLSEKEIEEDRSLYERLRRIDQGIKKLSRRGPGAHARFFGKPFREVFPRGKRVMVVGDPFLVFGEANLGCAAVHITEYEPAVEIPTPLFSVLNGYDELDDRPVMERMQFWLDRNFEYDWKSLHAKGFSAGYGINYEKMHVGYDYKEDPTEGSAFRTIYQAYANMLQLAQEIAEFSEEAIVANADSYQALIERYRVSLSELNTFYQVGFCSGQRTPLEGLKELGNRDDAYVDYVSFMLKEFPEDLAGLPEEVQGLHSILVEMNEIGQNYRAGRRYIPVFNSKLYRAAEVVEDPWFRTVSLWADEMRSDLYPQYEERVAEVLLERLDQHITYFKVIYPKLLGELRRMKSLGAPDRTRTYAINALEDTFWRSQFRVSQVNQAQVIHGYFPDIPAEEGSYDNIVSVYAHTAHGWNGINTVEGMKAEITANIKFLKVGGSMYAGPINHRKLVALQRGGDVSSKGVGASVIVADALDQLREEGVIEYEVYHPVLDDESRDRHEGNTRFLRKHNFSQGLIIRRLK